MGSSDRSNAFADGDRSSRSAASSDLTSDARWTKHFVNNRRTLGLYRTRVSYYWVLMYDPLKRDHILQHAGTAGDAATRFGS